MKMCTKLLTVHMFKDVAKKDLVSKCPLYPNRYDGNKSMIWAKNDMNERVGIVDQIMVLKNSNPGIGLHARNATMGEEYAMVEQFIDYYCSKFIHNNKKHRLAVFVEPRIDSGFPDVVFASYRPSILENWSDERSKLDVSDFKLLSFLCYTPNATGDIIISKLGLPERQTLKSLEKLLDAKLIVHRNMCWQARNIRDIFSITKLVAVEAKMSNVSKVVEQSFLNTWFASHSYAVTNSVNPHNDTIQSFSQCGVGLYCRGKQFKKVVDAKQYSLPSSYLSFQFNEWIGRTLAMA